MRRRVNLSPMNKVIAYRYSNGIFKFSKTFRSINKRPSDPVNSFEDSLGKEVKVNFSRVKIKKEHNLPEQLLNDLAHNKEEISKLQITLKNISLENKKLRQLNKEIMYEQEKNCSMTSTVHSFYQNMILPESEQNIRMLKKSIEEFKTKIVDLKKLNKKLKKENNELKIANARYKELVSQNVIGRRFNLDNGGISLKFRRGTIQHENDLIRNESITIETKLMRENKYLDLINNSLRRIGKTSTIKMLIEVLYEELDILLNRHKVGIFIINPELQAMYRKEKGLSQIIAVEKDKIELALHKDLIMIPAFTSIKSTKQIIKTHDTINAPINSLNSKDLYLIVQVESSHKDGEVYYKASYRLVLKVH